MAGLTLADFLRMQARGDVKEGKAKSVIQFWMGGGPSHLDTFDPKPEAGRDYCGPLDKPIATNKTKAGRDATALDLGRRIRQFLEAVQSGIGKGTKS